MITITVLSLIFLFTIGAVLWRTYKPTRVFVLQYQRGLLFRRGLLAKVLEPGLYWTFPTSGVTLVDMRLQVLNVSGQEILTADGITLKISLAGAYKVVDPEQFVTMSVSAVGSLYVLAQQALRTATAELGFEAMLTGRPALDARISEILAPQAAQLGLEVSGVAIRDLMLPSELRRAFAQAATAQKEGLGAMERARAETASLRSLANAARLMQELPTLLQLRAIQAAESSRGNTIVLGVSGEVSAAVSARSYPPA